MPRIITYDFEITVVIDCRIAHTVRDDARRHRRPELPGFNMGLMAGTARTAVLLPLLAGRNSGQRTVKKLR